MPSKTLVTYETVVTPTITLTSLANGAGRICAVVDNTTTRAPAAMVYLRATTGATATNNTPIKLYLIRRSNQATDLADGGLGTTDAAVTTEPIGAEQLGAITVTSVANTTYVKSFIAYDLSAKYSFVVWNAVGGSLNATAANFTFQVVPIVMEAQ